MLAKFNRLSRDKFSQFFKTGRRYNSAFATLIVAPHSNFHGAVVVSKKVSKKAVRRNLLRRRVYAKLYAALKNNKVGVFIMILKPPFNSLSKQEQHAEIERMIELAS